MIHFRGEILKDIAFEKRLQQNEEHNAKHSEHLE